jgi:hypothetical protein
VGGGEHLPPPVVGMRARKLAGCRVPKSEGGRMAEAEHVLVGRTRTSPSHDTEALQRVRTATVRQHQEKGAERASPASLGRHRIDSRVIKSSAAAPGNLPHGMRASPRQKESTGWLATAGRGRRRRGQRWVATENRVRRGIGARVSRHATQALWLTLTLSVMAGRSGESSREVHPGCRQKQSSREVHPGCRV